MTKLGVVSDVHNNADALRYALDALRGCDAVLSLGDLVSQHRATPEIVGLAREAGLLGLAGNHEKAVLAPCGFPLRQRMAPEDLAYLAGLPPRLELEVDGRRVLAVHGSPWDDPTALSCAYVYESDHRAMERLRSTEAAVLLLGHTHVASALRLGALLAFNPGSVGEARDRHHRLSFGILDFGAGRAAAYAITPGEPPRAFLEAEL